MTEPVATDCGAHHPHPLQQCPAPEARQSGGHTAWGVRGAPQAVVRRLAGRGVAPEGGQVAPGTSGDWKMRLRRSWSA
jgi:hypothetical protein